MSKDHQPVQDFEEELFIFKKKTLTNLERYKDSLEKLEGLLAEFHDLKTENAKLKKELDSARVNLDKLRKENNKLKSMKLVKLTRKYWVIRKKIIKGR